MARYRRPTTSNVAAARAIRQQTLQRIAALSATATAELDAAAAPNIDAQTRRGHLVVARNAEKQIDAAVIELAAAAVLGGMPAADVATRSGISTATLTRRMPPYLRALRGEHLVRDPDAPYGWRAAEGAISSSEQAFCGDPTRCGLNSSRSRSSSQEPVHQPIT
ncbi:Uncharacterised protein [Mycobacteroides abscessus subsp. abscessus]|nr:Uncharacterised protein [Mycobacteroides abscessus subsp. abscessus]SHP67239.1 Uncharacterised protein [Mycobacteroides abscessus subsp. abscessus]SHY38658.1 Uncharacterised protein [Mycobacteroides abscessus subsp. abscessus]SKD94860.1 Uncharacterised protein [Mycobacteroides abscessus subsp. abscessus]